jgi:hypothetical protein
MTILHIFKAQRTLRDLEIPTTTLQIEREIPNSNDLKEAEQIYQKEAETICEALYKSLPGGTFDHLVIEMLKRKVSLFKVSHSE